MNEMEYTEEDLQWLDEMMKEEFERWVRDIENDEQCKNK